LEPEARFEALLHSCLWGNRADLSNFTIKEKGRGGLAAHEERHLILINHTEDIRKLLSDGVLRIDFICDNVGSDLLFDLALTDFLLRRGWVNEIHFNLKNQPFFVSDAMPTDVLLTIDQLQKASGNAITGLGSSLGKRFGCQAINFGNRSILDDLPDVPSDASASATGLSHSALVLIKGDVNYRRLLDDRAWPHTTRMEEVCSYFPRHSLPCEHSKGRSWLG